MEKNIIVKKVGRSNDEYSYGQSEDKRFGWQNGITEKFLDKKLNGKNTGKLHISTTPKAGTFEVSMYTKKREDDRFKVTAPYSLRGAEFCKTGIQYYFGKAFAQQKRLKLYVKL